jgi:hypothetical protein
LHQNGEYNTILITQGIDMYVDTRTAVRARGTTLVADNGLMAAAVMVLEGKTIFILLARSFGD